MLVAAFGQNARQETLAIMEDAVRQLPDLPVLITTLRQMRLFHRNHQWRKKEAMVRYLITLCDSDVLGYPIKSSH